MDRALRLFGIVIAGSIVAAAIFAVLGYRNARSDPIVRRAAIGLPNWPDGAAPVRAILLSDIHIGNLAMDEARLARIVTVVDRARPDLVFVAGDFIAGHDMGEAAASALALMRQFARLRPRLGTFAVLGNHDEWTGPVAVRRALERAGVTVLDNRAVVRGPLAIGGVGDAFTGHDRPGETIAALRRLPGARIIVTHSPDIGPTLPVDIRLLLAGHTHCGQIVLPIIGAPTIPSRYGARYRCGMIREGARTTIVTAGVGTSVAPLRFAAPPDMWLLTLGPRPAALR